MEKQRLRGSEHHPLLEQTRLRGEDDLPFAVEQDFHDPELVAEIQAESSPQHNRRHLIIPLIIALAFAALIGIALRLF